MITLLANIWATIANDATIRTTTGGAGRVFKSWPSTLPELTDAKPAYITLQHSTGGGAPDRLHGKEQSLDLTIHTFALTETKVETINRRLQAILDGKAFRGSGSSCASANEGPSGIVQDPVRGAKHGYVTYTLLNVIRL